MKNYIMTVLVIVITAVAGFIMPPILLEWQDERRLESVEIQAAEEVVLTSQTELTLIEKLHLMKKDTVTRLSMAQGENYDWDTIIVQARMELETLKELGIFEPDIQDISYLTFSVDRVDFLVDIEDGTKSMMLWSVYAVSSEGMLTIAVDDETGKILSMKYSSYWTSVSTDKEAAYKIKETTTDELKKIAEKWGEYLGLTMVDTYDTQNPTADLEKEWEEEVGKLIEAGYSKEEAYEIVYTEWGGTANDLSSWLFVVYEDESGIAVYLFRKNSGYIIFSVELSM